MSRKARDSITGGSLAEKSDKDLETIRKAVETEQRKRAARKKRAAAKQIEDIARENDIDLASLAKTKARPVYRDPDNQFNTWNGRGRKPGWLQQALDRGLDLDDLKI